MTAPLTTHRDAIREIVPGFLRGFWGYRLMYAIAAQLDAIGDALTAGVKLRFPNLYSAESLPIIGRERGITRGFDEPDDVYSVRLENWWGDHRTKGNPYSLLRQLRGYFTPHAVKMRVVNNAGAWYTQNADGSLEYAHNSNWDWDGAPATEWSRYWVILYPPADLWVPDGTWGDGDVWGADGTTWGSTASIEQVETIRFIVKEWRGPHSVCVNIIVVFDPTAFDPTDTQPPLPDGTWAHWSKLVAGTQVPARDDRAIYWDGG